MMLFKDRLDAAQMLLKALLPYKNKPQTLICALPRGGVEIGAYLATHLKLPLTVVCPRKISAPNNPEFAIGAVGEKGAPIWLEQAHSYSKEELQIQREKAQKEAKRRACLYLKESSPISFNDQCILLVDDGVATGATILAAISQIQELSAKKIVLAIPVAPKETALKLRPLVDESVILETPSPFYTVGQFYETFSQVTDQQVLSFLSSID